MRQDVEIRIERQGKAVWQCRAEAETLRPRAADVDDDSVDPDVRMRLKFHYTSKLDPVLRTPGDYGLAVLNRVVPGATILGIQQTACGRYVELSI